MTILIAFHIYRTEQLTISGKTYAVHFTRRNDTGDYELYAVEQGPSRSSWRCSYSSETAADFARSQGKALEDEVFKVLKGDIERGLI